MIMTTNIFPKHLAKILHGQIAKYNALDKYIIHIVYNNLFTPKLTFKLRQKDEMMIGALLDLFINFTFNIF